MVPVCLPPRHWRVRLFRDDSAYFGKTSKGWFFGFKLHVLATTEKKICGCNLTPANYSDRVVAEALTEFIEYRTVIGDLGYSGERLQDELLEENRIGRKSLFRVSVTRKKSRVRNDYVFAVNDN